LQWCENKCAAETDLLRIYFLLRFTGKDRSARKEMDFSGQNENVGKRFTRQNRIGMIVALKKYCYRLLFAAVSTGNRIVQRKTQKGGGETTNRTPGRSSNVICEDLDYCQNK
jgi:hypothetical protein